MTSPAPSSLFCRGVGLLMAEDEGRYFFKQLVSAVDYCHRCGVLDSVHLQADNGNSRGQVGPRHAQVGQCSGEVIYLNLGSLLLQQARSLRRCGVATRHRYLQQWNEYTEAEPGK
jgi:hypothetical protein